MSNFNDACHLIRLGFNKLGTSSQAECSSLTPCRHNTLRAGPTIPSSHMHTHTNTTDGQKHAPHQSEILMAAAAASGGQNVNSSCQKVENKYIFRKISWQQKITYSACYIYSIFIINIFFLCWIKSSQIIRIRLGWKFKCLLKK